MTQVSILYPVFIQVLLFFVVAVLLLGARRRAMRSMKLEPGQLAMGKAPWPDEAVKRAANYTSQFELPVLFYAVVAFALIVKAADTIMIGLAWAFVLSRFLHTAIHVGSNRIRFRTPAFALGFLCVLLMWVRLALHVSGIF